MSTAFGRMWHILLKKFQAQVIYVCHEPIKSWTITYFKLLPLPQHFYVYIIKTKKSALVTEKEQEQASFA